MSAQEQIHFHGIKRVGQPARQLRPFVRFPFVNSEAVAPLTKAIDHEAHAGRAVLHGQLEEAEELRMRARAEWGRYREANGGRY